MAVITQLDASGRALKRKDDVWKQSEEKAKLEVRQSARKKEQVPDDSLQGTRGLAWEDGVLWP